MKPTVPVCILLACVIVVVAEFNKYQVTAMVTSPQQDNLSHDLILAPVKVQELVAEPNQSTEPFSVSVTFDNNVTNQQRVVFQQAINEWRAIIQTRGFTPGNYPIRFSNGTPNSGALATTTTEYNEDNGNLISASIVFDNMIPTCTNTITTNNCWYVDPNPSNDIEFNSTPPAGYDLLTVTRHELGHAFGWTGSKRVKNLRNTENIFDSPRLNIALATTNHTNDDIHVNDVMVPSIPVSTRRPISLYPSAAMLARAYSYDITMKFVDSKHNGTETGSANSPWNTLREAANAAPIDGLLLIIPGTYGEMPPFMLSRRLTIIAARGGIATHQ